MNLPKEVLELTDEQKRAFATLYWFGVCVGELVNLGMTEEELRQSFETCLSTAKSVQARKFQS